jgi:hypothetical protein
MTFRHVTMIFLGMLFALRGTGQVIEEYQVKAAFLYNFAKFVEWPSQAFETPKDPIMICVLGHNPFGNSLEEVIRGKLIGGRAIVFREVNDFEQANTCQILFVGAANNKRYRSLCVNLKSLGILTVGEAQGFAEGGGVIHFKLDGGRVRFDINVQAAERAQLHISSKLLSLAQVVKTEKTR